MLGLPYEVIMAAGLVIMLVGLLLSFKHWIFFFVVLAGAIMFGTGIDCLGIMPDRTCYPQVIPAMLPLSPEKNAALNKGIAWMVLLIVMLPAIHVFRIGLEIWIHGPKTLEEHKKEAEESGYHENIVWQNPKGGYDIHVLDTTTGEWDVHHQHNNPLG